MTKEKYTTVAKLNSMIKRGEPVIVDKIRKIAITKKGKFVIVQ